MSSAATKKLCSWISLKQHWELLLPSNKLLQHSPEAYARKFDIRPVFDQTVVSAEYDKILGFWRVRTVGLKEETEYVCRWLIVATGENAEAVMPSIEGMKEFIGPIMHTSLYKSEW